MQIVEKYKSSYQEALKKFRKERSRYANRLRSVYGIRVIPSQANFIMVELNASLSPKELLKVLLVKHDLLIKELTTKTNGGNYLRLAVRNKEEDDRLVNALLDELGKSE